MGRVWNSCYGKATGNLTAAKYQTARLGQRRGGRCSGLCTQSAVFGDFPTYFLQLGDRNRKQVGV